MITRRAILGALAGSMLVAGCGSSSPSSETTTTAAPETTAPATTVATTAATETAPPTDDSAAAEPVTFEAEVWADNWFSLYVNGELVGEDSVPITTERSFNADTITFSATYPLTIAMVGKDFKETDSGLEYIGTDRQQMGDGGLIAQITDTATGEVVAVTDGTWRSLVIHTAPTNPECESSANPDVECEFVIAEEPSSWTAADFDDSSWSTATVHTAEEVGVKDGYDTISWDDSAALIWSADLQTDNTILFRTTVAAP